MGEIVLGKSFYNFVKYLHKNIKKKSPDQLNFAIFAARMFASTSYELKLVPFSSKHSVK